jgi:integrase/recombinase XerD
MFPKEWAKELVVHNNEARILIRFERNKVWEQLIRKVTGARWSRTHSAWHIADTAEHRKKLGIALADKVKDAVLRATKLSEGVRAGIMALIARMRNKRYSEKTVESYVKALIFFFSYYAGKDILAIENADVVSFNTGYILKNGLSATYQSQFINGLKLLYETSVGHALQVDLLERPKMPMQLPKVLSEEEVAAIINALDNKKHRTMLSLMYSAGMRRGELLSLMLKDINSSRMLITIRNGKGMKDRVVPLSPVVLEMLREYYKEFKPKAYLFEGQYGGRYSERSIELVLKTAIKKAGLKKEVNLHMLRHSFATHLLEGGTNLRFIQELLGHSSPRTTQIYTHVSMQQLGKIVSPLDRLNLKK